MQCGSRDCLSGCCILHATWIININCPLTSCILIPLLRVATSQYTLLHDMGIYLLFTYWQRSTMLSLTSQQMYECSYKAVVSHHRLHCCHSNTFHSVSGWKLSHSSCSSQWALWHHQGSSKRVWSWPSLQRKGLFMNSFVTVDCLFKTYIIFMAPEWVAANPLCCPGGAWRCCGDAD